MFERIMETDSIQAVGSIFGPFDENIRLIENEFNVTIVNRENVIKVSGEADNLDIVFRVLDGLNALSKNNENIDIHTVRYVIGLVKSDNDSKISEMENSIVCITSGGKPIKAKTLGQKYYIDCIRKNTVTIGVGPAGTGKTYLAVAEAVASFRSKKVSKIILTRPAVEVGEKLGFLPGDLQSKVAPYLRPLYDGLSNIMDEDVYAKCLERGLIEVAPLAYMRGRTLDNSFIILDEAQNTTHEQMKMFLTRLGHGSKIVVTGDITQIDLPKSHSSGLERAINILGGIDDIAYCPLTDKDIVRHALVQKIVSAYSVYDEGNASNAKKYKINGR